MAHPTPDQPLVGWAVPTIRGAIGSGGAGWHCSDSSVSPRVPLLCEQCLRPSATPATRGVVHRRRNAGCVRRTARRTTPSRSGSPCRTGFAWSRLAYRAAHVGTIPKHRRGSKSTARRAVAHVSSLTCGAFSRPCQRRHARAVLSVSMDFLLNLRGSRIARAAAATESNQRPESTTAGPCPRSTPRWTSARVPVARQTGHGGLFARRAHGRCQGLQSLDAETSRIDPARRADEAAAFRPPSGRKCSRGAELPGARSPWQRSCALRAKRGCRNL
ncbi:hypothetical protein RAS1_39840 [Phycisphaerae bacterium RAS1]|nr:hypothetical protein RAS1_39840 [Phycisphaerae bacterium RAS1]